MKVINRAAALAALGLLLTGGAHAATLNTPPASSSFGSGFLGCRVTNVRATPIKVTVEVRNYSGTVLDSYGHTFAPGETTGSDSSGGVYCRFLVEGPKNAVRASATYFDGNGVVTSAIPAK